MWALQLHTVTPPPTLSSHSPSVNWCQHLPTEWRDYVVAPLDFSEYREYEIAAKRCFGYDIDGQPCYYTHHYALEESRSNDDEDFYQVTAYGELVCAWHLRDERWLIYRVIYTGEDCKQGRGFYSFAEQAPR